jgi:outer membrane protein insertion porin family
MRLRLGPLSASLLLPILVGAEESPVVREVLIEGVTRARAARLRPYLKLVPGQPLAGAAVRESVELLFATGDFEDVRVEQRPVAGGVAVVFLPRPAPRMSELRVRGDRVLGEKELRRITRLRWGEPLWEARLEEAGRDAALALVERGHPEARVLASALRVGEATTAVFDVQAGPLARVEQIAIEGASQETRRALLAEARPRSGESWRRSLAAKAAERMRRQLQARSRWRASVEVLEEYDPKTARVRLRFLVRPGPRIGLSFRGTRLPAELRRLVEQLVKEAGARGDALEEAGERVEQELHARGHRSPSVSHLEEQSPPDRVEIVYVVEAGAAAQVGAVQVLGVESLGLPPRLLTQAGMPLRDEVLERDAAALTRSLRELGFAEASVEPEVPEGGGTLPVVFRARTGPRSVVLSALVEAPSEAGVPVPPLLTQPGAAYRVRTVALDKATLQNAWRDAGFLHAEVEPEMDFADDKSGVRVVFRVEPGPRTLVGDVVVAGLQQTREAVVRRELGFKAGDPFSLTRVLDAQRRQQGLGVFERVSARELVSSSTDSLPVVIAAEEAPRSAVSYGLGYAERDLLRGSVEVTLRNLYGMDRSLSSFARISFRGSRLFATYREPRLFGRRQELFVTGFREEQDRDAFDFVRYGGLLQTARALSSRLTLITRLTYQLTDVFNVDVPLDEIDRQFRSSTFSGPSASLVLDTRNDPLDPRRGQFVGADLGLSHGLLGGDSFVKGFLQAASYAPLKPRLVLALQGRLGLSGTFRGEPPRLPLPDRFFAGGDYSLRGFAIDAVNPEGGNSLLLGSAELRFAVRPRFELAAFSDAGNVFPLASDLALRDLRYSAGLGLRYKSSIGPLRVDWGYKLNRRAGEKGYQLHVTVGHAF